jgi:PAS domain S-box-containing protein
VATQLSQRLVGDGQQEKRWARLLVSAVGTDYRLASAFGADQAEAGRPARCEASNLGVSAARLAVWMPEESTAMAQMPLELILTRQLASYLATPMFLVGHEGELLFYNEAAEAVLGYRFDDVVELPLAAWIKEFPLFNTTSGQSLAVEEIPLARALRERRPVHDSILYQRPDGERFDVTVTAIPLIGQGGKVLGAAAIFWVDVPEKEPA